MQVLKKKKKKERKRKRGKKAPYSNRLDQREVNDCVSQQGGRSGTIQQGQRQNSNKELVGVSGYNQYSVKTKSIDSWHRKKKII